MIIDVELWQKIYVSVQLGLSEQILQKLGTSAKRQALEFNVCWSRQSGLQRDLLLWRSVFTFQGWGLRPGP